MTPKLSPEFRKQLRRVWNAESRHAGQPPRSHAEALMDEYLDRCGQEGGTWPGFVEYVGKFPTPTSG
jgi:hypothetical protein